MFRQDETPALRLGVGGVFDLIAPARTPRQGHQEVRFAEGEPLVEGVRARPGDHQIRRGDDVAPVIGDELALHVAALIREGLVEFAGAADVDHVVVFEQGA